MFNPWTEIGFCGNIENIASWSAPEPASPNANFSSTLQLTEDWLSIVAINPPNNSDSNSDSDSNSNNITTQHINSNNNSTNNNITQHNNFTNNNNATNIANAVYAIVIDEFKASYVEGDLLENSLRLRCHGQQVAITDVIRRAQTPESSEFVLYTVDDLVEVNLKLCDNSGNSVRNPAGGAPIVELRTFKISSGSCITTFQINKTSKNYEKEREQKLVHGPIQSEFHFEFTLNGANLPTQSSSFVIFANKPSATSKRHKMSGTNH